MYKIWNCLSVVDLKIKVFHGLSLSGRRPMTFGCRYVDILITRCSGIGPYQPSGYMIVSLPDDTNIHGPERALLHEGKGCHDPLAQAWREGGLR